MPDNCAAREKQKGLPFISGVIQTSKLWFLPSTLLHGLALYLSTYRAPFQKVPSENGGTEQGLSDCKGQS